MKITAEEAASHLNELIHRAVSGGEVVIASHEKQSVRLVPCPAEDGRPIFGSAKGLLKISDDFDEPLADFDSYMR